MQSIINAAIGFILALGVTSATFEFYTMLKKEALTRILKASPRLSSFTQQMTGHKNDWK